MELAGRNKHRGRRRDGRDLLLDRQFNLSSGDQQDFFHLVIMKRNETTWFDPLLPDGCLPCAHSGITEVSRADPGDLVRRQIVVVVNRHGGSIANNFTLPPVN